MDVFQILFNYNEAFFSGLYVTLKLCLIIWSSGIIIGILLGIIGNKFKYSIGLLISLATFLLSSIPALITLFWLHYPLQAILNIVVDPFFTTAFALSLINIFSISDLTKRNP